MRGVPVFLVEIPQQDLPVTGHHLLTQEIQFLLAQGELRPCRVFAEIVQGAVEGDFRNLPGMADNENFFRQQTFSIGHGPTP